MWLFSAGDPHWWMGKSKPCRDCSLPAVLWGTSKQRERSKALRCRGWEPHMSIICLDIYRSWAGQLFISNLQTRPISYSHNLSLGFLMLRETEGFLSMNLAGLGWLVCRLTPIQTHTYWPYREMTCSVCTRRPFWDMKVSWHLGPGLNNLDLLMA